MTKVKYEIERRFLVKKLIYKFLRRAKKINIKQGYFELAIIDVSFRVRIINDCRAVITVKSGRGIKRKEDEYKIDIKLGRKLLAICHHRLEKVRYVINGWEVDFFKGPLKGLITTERELGSVKEKVKLPYWIKEAVEVTDSLTSHHLARLASELKGSGYKAACRLGDGIREAWQNHPNFVFVSNEDGWSGKIKKVKKVIEKVLK